MLASERHAKRLAVRTKLRLFEERWFLQGPQEIMQAVSPIPGVRWASFGWSKLPDDLVPWLIDRYGLRPETPLPPPADIDSIRMRLPETFDRFRPYQWKELGFLVDRAGGARGNGAMSGSDMGVGKSSIALAAMATLDAARPWIIVCPSIAKYVWVDQAREWLGVDVTVLEHRGLASWEKHRKRGSPRSPFDDDPWIIAVNYEILEDWAPTLKRLRPAGIVADEAHLLRGPRSRRGEKIRGRWIRKVEEDGTIGFTRKYGFAEGLDYRIALSGTPVWNRPDGLWGIVQYLRPDQFGGFSKFTERYQAGHLDEATGIWTVGKVINRKELNARMADVMIRHAKTDPGVAPYLPPKIRRLVRVDVDNPIKLPSLNGFSKSAVETVLRQSAAFKVGPAALNALDALSQGAKRVVVWTYLIDQAHAIATTIRASDNAINPDVFVCTGKVPHAKRLMLAKQFNVTDPAVWVGTMDSSGVAISLHGATHVCFADLDYVPPKMLQAEDRVWRYGVSGTVTVDFLACNGGGDAHVAEIVRDKLEQAQAAIGPDASATDLADKLDDDGGEEVLDELRALVEAA